MTEVQQSAATLMRCVEELNGLSTGLLEVERRIASLEIEITQHVEDFQIALWEQHVKHGDKLPAAEIRLALAHRAFDRDRYNQYLTLQAARRRAKSRISDLREIVAAHRSIVSAAKTELDATSGPQPAWSGQS